MPAIKFICSDKAEVTTEREIVTAFSYMIRNMIADLGEEVGETEPIPLADINSDVLKKILEWCQRHHTELSTPSSNAELREWDRQYFQVDQEMLFSIILGSNFLEMIGLLNQGCDAVADLIKGKSSAEIRALFNIEDDLTDAEKEEIRKENEWAEDR